jgi:hypothetical protein
MGFQQEEDTINIDRFLCGKLRMFPGKEWGRKLSRKDTKQHPKPQNPVQVLSRIWEERGLK